MNQELIEAVQKEDLSAIKQLLAAGVDLRSADEGGWTALNWAAGKGNLEIVQCLVHAGSDLFNVGKDNRTPYKIAICASHGTVARFLANMEEQRGGDLKKISSREWQNRPYCKAYQLRLLEAFSGWNPRKNVQVEDVREDGTLGEKRLIASEDVVFIHEDFTVTTLIWRDEDIIFDEVSDAWKDFCFKELGFCIPTDFDLLAEEEIQERSHNG